MSGRGGLARRAEAPRIDAVARPRSGAPRVRVAHGAWRGWPDWMIGSVGLALFAVAVQAILAVVHGWSVPSHLWSAGAVFGLSLMTAHALVRAALDACRRDAIAALRCAGAAAGLAACLAAVVLLAGAASPASGPAFDDPGPDAAGDVR
ncbi:MAG: hypothetical protein ACTHL8_11530 [Burkholderiaceae bacterium]